MWAVSPYSYVGLSLHTAMWAVSPYSYVGLSLHTAMWAVSPYSYVGLSLHTAMWAVSPYSYGVALTHITLSNICSLLSPYRKDQWGVWPGEREQSTTQVLLSLSRSTAQLPSWSSFSYPHPVTSQRRFLVLGSWY